MTKEEAIQQLKIIQVNNDTENAHILADDVLCELLISLGFKDVMEEYNKIYKWYA